MPSALLKKLAVHASHYSFGSLLTTMAGFFTFPFLTRVLSVSEYGIMNLISVNVTLLVGVGKVGVQHSIVRYHSETRAGKRPFGLPTLYSTAVFGMLGTGLATAVVWSLGVGLAPASWFPDPRVRFLFILVATVVASQVLESCLLNLLRAEEHSRIMVQYSVAKKYAGIALMVFVLLRLSQNLTGYYGAMVASETAFAVGLALVLFRRGAPRPAVSPRLFSPPLFKEMLGFGLPMMIGYELSGIILSVGDRYVVDGFLGPGPLGVYSAAYNLCQYVQTIFIASVGQAVMPIYMRLWEEKGPKETAAFLSQSLRVYVMLGIPLVAGLAAVGPELLRLTASEKYAAGAIIIPCVIAGMLVDGANAMVGAGLFIHRDTPIIMKLVIGSAIGNILMNLFLVPRIGILGAAVATLVSYVTLSIGMAIGGRRHVVARVPLRAVAVAVVSAVAMYLAVLRIDVGSRLGTVAVRVAVGGAIYGILVAIGDRPSRAAALAAIARARGYLR